MKGYEEVIDFIASGPSPSSIVSFRPSPEASERVATLIEREKTTGLSPEEKAELDHYLEFGAHHATGQSPRPPTPRQ